MTVAEFYKWAVENNVQDYNILIQYRDDGGYYHGEDELFADDYYELNHEQKTIKI